MADSVTLVQDSGNMLDLILYSDDTISYKQQVHISHLRKQYVSRRMGQHFI